MAFPWNVTGTDTQRAITLAAIDRIKFPFERLTLPGTPELGWRDLNGDDEWWLSKGRMHADEHEKPETLEGEVNGRRFIMGVFFPLSARIYVDVQLTQYPELAAATIGAEIAHAVDEFLPMTDAQRNEFLRLWNQPNTTWWEVSDYSAEYYRLGGEAFMHEFVAAYSDIQFGNKSDFLHDVGVEPADVIRIVGVQRTDYAPPVPTPQPLPATTVFERYGKSLIYHKPTHYPTKVGIEVTDTAGLRPCKVCKP